MHLLSVGFAIHKKTPLHSYLHTDKAYKQTQASSPADSHEDIASYCIHGKSASYLTG